MQEAFISEVRSMPCIDIIQENSIGFLGEGLCDHDHEVQTDLLLASIFLATCQMIHFCACTWV
jgi:hypothetical protein